ncbi:tripartite tricarboxylate transporter TctB family protein [Indiicoccus explosivorum]|uniref:tripartite tricarboxylate transporter TctB family protein n=1 Tax=Indiicoccus explosivorum TaxID=1917864 RepID=UPI00139010D8|nr:tripartite tricarboxylate transporter TctB family protein [Indiicoccus explosivorum]
MLKNYAMWIGLLVFGFAAMMFYGSFSMQYYGPYGPGPGFFPRWISGVLAAVALLYIGDSIRKEKRISFAEAFPTGVVLVRLLTIVASILIFIFIAPFTGYIIASVLVMLMLLLPDVKWYTSVAVAVSVSLALFFVFDTFLNIPLPANALGW